MDLQGLRMHTAEAGEGEALVLLHGFPQHWWAWRHLIPPLAERYRVICPDLRGFGWSDAPPDGYGYEQMARDVLQLLDALGVGRFRLAGHDWGGLAGFLLCLRSPDRIERYLALSTGHPYLRLGWRGAGSLWRLWDQPLLCLPVVGPAAAGSEAFLRLLVRQWTADRSTWSPRDRELFLGQFEEPERARAVVLHYRTALPRELLPILLGRYRSLRLRTPTLFIHGSRDPVRPALLGGWEAYADDMTLELVNGAGHFIAEERSDLVLERALEFFA